MTEALKASFASWEKEQLKLNIVKGLASWVGSILDVKCQTFSQASSLGFPAVLCCHGQTVSPAPFLSVSMNYLSWR
ncbi:hypothetical protein RUM43_006985 [Polyplax serrata]|uniref:Uncharacterized protein n=1 Tax=Polyplax serrata TaxID=468196 RepID=A0AAN8S0Z7_POLSC